VCQQICARYAAASGRREAWRVAGEVERFKRGTAWRSGKLGNLWARMAFPLSQELQGLKPNHSVGLIGTTKVVP
jgi:hypothetical protein